MNVREMTIDQLIARRTEIAGLIDTDGADLDALEAEAREITAELQRRAAEETRRNNIRSMVASGSQAPVATPPVQTPAARSLDEIRASREYRAAFLHLVKTGDDSECRALLTTNTTGTGLTGYVPVPTFLETEIRTAWENHRLLGLVNHSYLKGNVKIGFEVSATGATVHIEGTPAPDEEQIVLGEVEIKAENIKKWIRISDESLEGTTVDTEGYIYKEITKKIIAKAEEVLIGKIIGSPAAATTTAPGVPQLSANPAEDTIVNALAMLSAEAENLHITMNRQTYPVFRKIELGANYQIDTFEGLRSGLVYTDKLPAFGTASTGDVYAIIGDFGSGAQANFPNGDTMSILKDPYTNAEADLVKIVGREYVGIAVVADKRFVVLKKAAVG
jgi:HK97 family phage major capsid protein